MKTLKQIYFASVLIFALLSTAAAQDSATVQRTSLTITAVAAGERVRITAPSSIVQLHVEVYAASGEKLFDQEIRAGNVFDWHLQDGQAQRLAPGNYVCVVTAKSISGRLTQKIGTVSVEEKSASVQPAESQQLSVAQAQTIGPVEENSSWTIPGNVELQTGTVIAHDGTDGQMIRGRGALTFRIGNFFSGIDTEQMRLTEDGRLGVGTSNPEAKLDVAGTIRAERFLVAKPNTPGNDRKAQADDTDSAQPLVAGTGTQNRIAKWTDNAGTLGDSAITETGGNVGIGTTTPGSKLVVSANSTTLPPASGVARFADADGGQTAVFADAFNNNAIFNVRRANGTAAAPLALQANQLLGVIGASGYGASAYMGTRARVAFWASEMWTNTANGTYLTFNTTANGAATAGGAERMRIDNAGNVGIGTTTPATPLEVNGLLRSTRSGVAAQYIQLHGGDSGSIKLTAQSAVGAEKSLFIQNLSGEASQGPFNTIQFQLGTTASPSTKMIIDPDGNVGVGTINPTSKLFVLNSTPGTIAVFAESGSGRGVWGKSTSSIGVFGESTSLEGVFGVSSSAAGVRGASTSNSGVYGESPVSSLTAGGVYGKGTGSGSIGVIGEANINNAVGVFGVSTSPAGVGVYARNLSGGRALFVEGNAVQSLNKFGLVKAMIELSAAGLVTRCYNAQMLDGGASLPPSGITGCGFVVVSSASSQHKIDFGFQVDDRFAISTAIWPGSGEIVTANISRVSTTVLAINYEAIDGTFPLRAVQVFVF